MSEQMTLEQVREQMARIMEPGDHLISAWIDAIDATSTPRRVRRWLWTR